MGRLKQYQAGFTVGELDPLLRGRIDLQQYYSSVALADNCLFEPQGGFSRRPGLRFVSDLTADNPGNGVLLMPFEFSTTQNFMIVASYFSTSHTIIRLRFYANQTLLGSINGSSNSYLDFDVGTLYDTSTIDMDKTYFTQSADTLIVVNEDFAPFSIVRGANNSTWTVAALSLTVPISLFTIAESNPSATLTPSAVSGTVTLTANSSIFTDAMIDQYVSDNTDLSKGMKPLGQTRAVGLGPLHFTKAGSGLVAVPRSQQRCGVLKSSSILISKPPRV